MTAQENLNVIYAQMEQYHVAERQMVEELVGKLDTLRQHYGHQFDLAMMICSLKIAHERGM